jgi:hypothetical protein
MAWQLMVGCATATTVAAAWWALRRGSRVPGDPARRRVWPRRRAAHAPDPLETLALQVRLSELAAEMRRIEADPDVYARAHHYLAVQGAYDALLREACRLTGLPVEDVPLRAGFRAGDDERFREELELSSRGWSW